MTTRVLALISCLSLAACGADPRRGDDGTGPGPGGPDANTTGPVDPVTGEHILMLDFRSGWWAGSAGTFYQTVLEPLRNAADDITIEFHHLTVGQDVKCVYVSHGAAGCATVGMSSAPTPAEVVARFDLHDWNDYTQVWILSGSEKDMSDITVSGDLFGHFISQAGTSCIPVFLGAGDGFIDHANAMAQTLGIGGIMSTEFAQPGFFFGTSNVTVDTQMVAGTNMDPHTLFSNVNVIADAVGNGLQHTHGDSLVPNPMVQVIAHDSTGRPAIGVGAIPLPTGDVRPFVIDSGMQRYYGSVVRPDTLTLLLNIRKYLASSGCHAIIQ